MIKISTGALDRMNIETNPAIIDNIPQKQYLYAIPSDITSLAQRGVLFLDEFPKFGTLVLEVMCQPMDDKVVTISCAKGSLMFNEDVQLDSGRCLRLTVG